MVLAIVFRDVCEYAKETREEKKMDIGQLPFISWFSNDGAFL